MGSVGEVVMKHLSLDKNLKDKNVQISYNRKNMVNSNIGYPENICHTPAF